MKFIHRLKSVSLRTFECWVKITSLERKLSLSTLISSSIETTTRLSLIWKPTRAQSSPRMTRFYWESWFSKSTINFSSGTVAKRLEITVIIWTYQLLNLRMTKLFTWRMFTSQPLQLGSVPLTRSLGSIFFQEPKADQSILITASTSPCSTKRLSTFREKLETSLSQMPIPQSLHSGTIDLRSNCHSLGRIWRSLTWAYRRLFLKLAVLKLRSLESLTCYSLTCSKSISRLSSRGGWSISQKRISRVIIKTISRLMKNLKWGKPKTSRVWIRAEWSRTTLKCSRTIRKWRSKWMSRRG